MTKSSITRDELNEVIATYGKHHIAHRMAIVLLAAMDSEPVAYIFKHPAGRLFWSLTDESNKGHDDVMPVYAAPQPALVVPEGYVLAPKKPTVDMICAVRDYVAPLAGLDAFEAAYMAMLQAVDTSRNPASEGLKD